MKGNIWKVVFFTLLAGNIVVISLFFILMNWPVKDKPLTNSCKQ